jgi:hypothetical protein
VLLQWRAAVQSLSHIWAAARIELGPLERLGRGRSALWVDRTEQPPDRLRRPDDPSRRAGGETACRPVFPRQWGFRTTAVSVVWDTARSRSRISMGQEPSGTLVQFDPVEEAQCPSR